MVNKICPGCDQTLYGPPEVVVTHECSTEYGRVVVRLDRIEEKLDLLLTAIARERADHG